MKLELNEKELLTLGKLVCLGQWIVQCEELPEETEKEYNNIGNKVFQALSETKYKEYADQGAEENIFTSSVEMTEACDEYLEDYSNSYFFTKIIDILAENQLRQKLGTAQYETIEYEELIEMAEPVKKKLFKHIMEKGFDKLSLF